MRIEHAICSSAIRTANHIGPGSLNRSAHRVQGCAAAGIASTVNDSTGSAPHTSAGNPFCTSHAVARKMPAWSRTTSRDSEHGRDEDSIPFTPK